MASLSSTHDKPVLVDRYAAGARINHWVTAISFILLALSGLAFFTPSLYFLTGLFGGGQLARTLHPWIGVVLFVSFSGLFVRFWKANLWNRDDSAWMSKLPDVVAGHEEKLPEIGKYNAGQKLVFWGMALLILVLFATGLVIWQQYFGAASSIDQQRVALLLHAAAAVGTILIWIVHVYAAIWVRGTIQAMTRGNVTGGWGWRHHRKWLREEVQKGEVKTQPAE
ncbi:formate dehydrogenase subunit gamma [Alsobacter metallidurans]|uniref:Formate dehydrogenase subunit gamma n=1 Tax=Alsobacter metallidurans TaxID=340221 RepID=A0A917I425_9HYPH|nr:formate dehydrogenase subunit gamma [Alsobacter metallidurans]GGH07760.1 formate dehydrogenase subunit gamma [Alsobacter metallidurans]